MNIKLKKAWLTTVKTMKLIVPYSIMILIMVMYSFTKTNTQHCYKSYKIPIGVYMIQSQPKAIRYPQTWTLELCLMQCIFLVTPIHVTKINHVPYQTIQYDDKGMFPAQLIDDTPVQVFIDNGPTPSILPLSITTNIQYYKNT